MDPINKTYYEQELEKIKNSHYKPEHYYIQVRQSKEFMENNFSDRIILKSLAIEASMSKFHYIRVFQQVYGITPKEYLRDLRIKKAKELLKHAKSNTEVCYEVGYNSLSTFSNVFKKEQGIHLEPIKN